MRKIKYPKIGEYVLVTRWGDRDIQDPCFLGHIKCIKIMKDDIRYIIEEDKTEREYPNCFRIYENDKDVAIYLENILVEKEVDRCHL